MQILNRCILAFRLTLKTAFLLLLAPLLALFSALEWVFQGYADFDWRYVLDVVTDLIDEWREVFAPFSKAKEE